MEPEAFETADRTPVPALTASEMQEVDRVATDSGLVLASMVENAGRNLARVVSDRAGDGAVAVLAGGGTNGAGGMACARHLANRDVPVSVVLDRPPGDLVGGAALQHRVLDAMGIGVRSDATLPGDVVAVDALVGYGLEGGLEGRTADLAETCNGATATISLDVPSGLDATTGERPGPAVDPDLTLTLALPKTGLGPDCGRILVGDVGIPASVYRELEIPYESPFDRYVVPVRPREASPSTQSGE